MKQTIRPTSARRRQSGITLAIMLVMLVVIAMTSVAVIRGAMNADRVSNNLRLQTSATQMAQLALRYCEVEALKAASATVVLHAKPASPNPANWEVFSNWFGGSKIAVSVPTSYLAAASVTPNPGFMPQCLAEKGTAGTTETIIVTARGFSPDYAEDSTGKSSSGSTIWLQSTMAVAAVPTP